MRERPEARARANLARSLEEARIIHWTLSANPCIKVEQDSQAATTLVRQ